MVSFFILGPGAIDKKDAGTVSTMGYLSRFRSLSHILYPVSLLPLDLFYRGIQVLRYSGTTEYLSILGLLVIPGAALGQMFGGFVIRHWKMKVQTILKFLVAVVALAMISKACFFINCDIVVWNTNITDR
jgi:hypothetical protein